MEKKVGIIESVDNRNKIVNFYGYGEYIGEFSLPKDLVEKEFDLCNMDISAPKIKLDDGREIWIAGSCWFSEQDIIKRDLLDYEQKGYTIKQI